MQMNTEELIRTALGHERAGQSPLAEKIYNEILEREPEQPLALCMLGVMKLRREDLDGAIELLRRAIISKPDFSDAQKNLGSLLARKGKLEEAVKAYQKALELRPGDARAHFDLGNIFLRQNKSDEALAEYSKAVEQAPDLAGAHGKLGDLLIQKGLVDQAAVEYRRYFECLGSLTNLVLDERRKEEGVTQYLIAIGYSTDSPKGPLTAGRALPVKEPPEVGLVAGGSAAHVKKEGVDVHAWMAINMARMRRFNEAEAAYRCAVSVAPHAAITHVAMGEILYHRGDVAEAIECYYRALNVDPNSIHALGYLTTALRAQGRFDEATACCEKMLKIGPGLNVAYASLASMGNLKGDQPEIQELLSKLEQPGLSIDNQIALGFALGKAFDDSGRFDEAFVHFAAANSLAKKYRAEGGDVYDPKFVDELIGQLLEAFPAEYFRKRMDWGEASELPVFVCGMPRSGTTLIQQIAASHPQIHGAGELHDIAEIARRLGGLDLAANADQYTPEKIRTAAQRQVKHLQGLAPKALRVIDKMPPNVYRLGLIRLLFPSARVILCRRDPRDCCLSCYFQWFSEGNAFAFDLAHCGHEHLMVDRAMAHWREVLPLRMLEVQYEDVVADLEGQSRRLIDFLGLPWDPACLEFHKTPSTIRTASVWQVRQPIYDRSVGRWRNYEKHLGPLFDVLNRLSPA
jgi:tetratricopeptide (TPR) repeat protein